MKIRKLHWIEYGGSHNAYFVNFGLIFKIHFRDNCYHATGSKNDAVCVDKKLETLDLAKQCCQEYFQNMMLEGLENE